VLCIDFFAKIMFFFVFLIFKVNIFFACLKFCLSLCDFFNLNLINIVRKMKIKVIVFVCAAVMMAACGGKKAQTAEGDACCSSHVAEASCSNAATADCCSSSSVTLAAASCCSSATATACAMACTAKKFISAKVYIKPEKVESFLTATQELIEKSRAEEGCISYTLFQNPTDETSFLFFEEWRNQAAIDYHFETEHFINFGRMLDEYASVPPVITIFASPDAS